VNLVRRRRVERALRESEERLDVAAHSSGAGLWGLELDTRRIWATSRLRELFQLSPVDDLEVEAVLAVVHPADRERVRRAFGDVEAPASEVGLEFRIVRADGSERWIATWGQRNDARHDKVRRWSGASIDVTDRRRGEAEMQALRQELAHVARVAMMGEL